MSELKTLLKKWAEEIIKGIIIGVALLIIEKLFF